MKTIAVLLLGLVLSGCLATSEIQQGLQFPEVPELWHAGDTAGTVEDNWIAQFNQPQLLALIDEALATHQGLRQQAYAVDILKQRLIQAQSDFWPDLDLSLASSRARSASTQVIETSQTLRLAADVELDLWGKLSDAQRQARLDYLAARAQYLQDRENLVAELVTAWFDLVSAHRLSVLFEQRVRNAEQNLEIIESGYQQGLNASLDVYLSRNELNSERSNLASQNAQSQQLARELERTLGRYPSAEILQLAEGASLPQLNQPVPLGLPSELIRRKPALQASWYQVLAQDAALAFAHKQRFPSLILSASGSDADTRLSDLLSGGSLGWSLAGSLTAPLFRAGELKASEEIARLQLRQQEQVYLETLYDAFASAANAMTREKSLKEQYQATLAAQSNAEAAQNLAFEQYQRGLVTYTTVLEAQSRSFNAQSALIQISNQQLANRVALNVALGGQFTRTSQSDKDSTSNE